MKSLGTLPLLVVIILVCILNVSSQGCNRVCTEDINYVCGTTNRNGRIIYCTFTNQCKLDIYACRKRETWRSSPRRCRRDSSANDCN
ncbi:vasotab [Drosophila willistoni]|uniref:vasotab n=1 Tax=Drosophila willistoni TaxID=7260 RepID=UPI000C26C305|nr:vasotab [Drosophila willistoni]